MTQEDAIKMDYRQAINILVPLRNMMRDQHGCPISDAYFALDKAINALTAEPERKKGKWIPCSERLPEVGQDILMSVGGMYTAEGCLREDGDWAQFRWDAIQRKDMVGAWMPLPEPWRGEE